MYVLHPVADGRADVCGVVWCGVVWFVAPGVTPEDYHQLLLLLCEDFPASVVAAGAEPLSAWRVAAGMPATSRALPFGILSTAVQVAFYYVGESLQRESERACLRCVCA